MMGDTETVLATGDLSRLSEEQRVSVYAKTCEALGLNPVTRPLEYLRLGGRLVLYLRKEATDQLRRLHGVSIEIRSMRAEGDLYVVHASARLGDRVDEEVGIVSIKGLTGEALAIAQMRALSKAKHRVTLSIVGLGFYDDEDGAVLPPVPARALPSGNVDGQAESIDEAIRRWQAYHRANNAPDDIRALLIERHRQGLLTPGDVDAAIDEAQGRLRGEQSDSAGHVSDEGE